MKVLVIFALLAIACAFHGHHEQHGHHNHTGNHTHNHTGNHSHHGHHGHHNHSGNHTHQIATEEELSKIGDIFHKIGKAVGIAVKVVGAVAEEEALHLPTHNVFRPHHGHHNHTGNHTHNHTGNHSHHGHHGHHNHSGNHTHHNRTHHVATEEELSKIGDIFHKIGKVVGIGAKIAGAIAEEEAFRVSAHHNHTHNHTGNHSHHGHHGHHEHHGHHGHHNHSGNHSHHNHTGNHTHNHTGNHSHHGHHGHHNHSGNHSHHNHSKVAIALFEEEALHLPTHNVFRPHHGHHNQTGNHTHNHTGNHTHNHTGNHTHHNRTHHVATEEELSKIGDIFHKIGKAVGIAVKVVGAVAEEEAIHIDVDKIKHGIQVVGNVAGKVSQIAGIIGGAEEENFNLPSIIKNMRRGGN